MQDGQKILVVSQRKRASPQAQAGALRTGDVNAPAEGPDGWVHDVLEDDHHPGAVVGQVVVEFCGRRVRQEEWRGLSGLGADAVTRGGWLDCDPCTVERAPAHSCPVTDSQMRSQPMHPQPKHKQDRKSAPTRRQFPQLGQPPARNEGEIVVLIVVAHVEGEPVQGAVVRVRLLRTVEKIAAGGSSVRVTAVLEAIIAQTYRRRSIPMRTTSGVHHRPARWYDERTCPLRNV